MAVCTRYC